MKKLIELFDDAKISTPANDGWYQEEILITFSESVDDLEYDMDYYNKNPARPIRDEITVNSFIHIKIPKEQMNNIQEIWENEYNGLSEHEFRKIEPVLSRDIYIENKSRKWKMTPQEVSLLNILDQYFEENQKKDIDKRSKIKESIKNILERAEHGLTEDEKIFVELYDLYLYLRYLRGNSLTKPWRYNANGCEEKKQKIWGHFNMGKQREDKVNRQEIEDFMKRMSEKYIIKVD